MHRIPEPELMNDALQARAYAAADFSAGDQALVERVLVQLHGPGGSAPCARASEGLEAAPAEGAAERLVDLGCGPGNISFRLAQALPQATVLALDGAKAMLELARLRQQNHPERWRGLRFEQACLPLPPGALDALPEAWRPPFSTLVCNSLLHHLHDPQVLWRSVRQLGRPGALVVVRDLRRPEDSASLETLVKRHAADAPAVLRRDFRHSLQAAFRPAEVLDQLTAAGLEQFSVTALGDRHLEVIGRLA